MENIHGERLGLMVAVISFMFMAFFVILMDTIQNVKDYRRYLVNRKKESKYKFLKEVEEYDKSKTFKSRRH